jgi:hypothetical protein
MNGGCTNWGTEAIVKPQFADSQMFLRPNAAHAF